MSAEVLVFVDVDGVLNAVHFQTPPGWAWPDEETTGVAGFGIRYSPTLIERLNRLADLPHVTMHWLTTWEHDAATRLSPQIGLRGGEWAVVGTEQHYSKELSGGWWKFHALRDLIAETKPARFVWLDDDLNYDRDALDWLAERTDALWICPSATLGLTPEHMDRIEAYVGVTTSA